ncbi:MAG TPA: hypothetical protein VLM40_16380 [Gemmata sp.]|nr:hypothetical protein [Gemmata sp.]
MSTSNPPPDQAAAISAAELRRRLLASTPPPTPAAAAEATTTTPAAESQDTTTPSGTVQPLIAQLRMPGKSGIVAVPTSRPSPQVPIAIDPVPTRPPVSRRTPTNGRLDPESALAGALNNLSSFNDSSRYDDAPHPDYHRIKSENKELRKLLGEMKQLLQEASETEQKLLAKDKEIEEVTTAKNAEVEELRTELVAIEQQIANGELIPKPPIPKTRGELEEWSDELEKESAKLQQEKKRLEEERRQLRDDEEALESQMREMEVSMARERALLARQETELRRLSAEIQHELELMQRGDANLREQMAKFQRRAQEVLTNPSGRR